MKKVKSKILIGALLALTVFSYSCSSSNAVKGGVIGGAGGCCGWWNCWQRIR